MTDFVFFGLTGPESDALRLVLNQKLMQTRGNLRAEGGWCTIAIGEPPATEAFIEIDSLDDRKRHVARTRLVLAAPAAARLVLEIGPLLGEVLAARNGSLIVNEAKVREFIALRDQVIAALEGRS